MSEERRYLRFPLAYRLEHWIFMLGFTTLGVTGLIQKYASWGISKSIFRLLGGIENARTIHHAAAFILMLEVVYHLGAVGYRLFVLRKRPSMMPGPQDIVAAIQSLLYNLGLSKRHPQQGHFTFEEKAEYWAVVWGMIVMGITGFMMWNPIATTHFLPGEFIPAAKMAHGGEAVLAVLAIALWHGYHVLVRHFNRSMFTGMLTEEEMAHDHPRELADIKAGINEVPVVSKVLAARRRFFLPIYGVFALLMLFGAYKFVTLETTALAALPPAETVKVYLPLTPTPLPTPLPTATPLPQAAVPSSWEDGIGEIFLKRCSACHGPASPMANLNLSSYQSILAGSSGGPGIVPGDLNASVVYTKQLAGGHPGQFTAQELEYIKQWILLGVPEK